MTVECPNCKSPVAREGQAFCYRCGHELKAYWNSLNLKGNPSEPADPLNAAASNADVQSEALPAAPKVPASTVVLAAHAFDAPQQPPPGTPQAASLKILLPTGDVFDREITNRETQIGKGPRNDIVIADPAVSAAHALLRLDGGVYTIKDIGSRNGTFINGERVTDTRQLNHGDVVKIGLSKLTFRVNEYSETAAIVLGDMAAAGKPAVPPPLTEESLAYAVVASGLAEKADVDRLRGDEKGRRLCRALIEDRLTSEEGLLDLMSRTFKIPVIDLNNTQIDEAVVAEFSPRLAREHQVFAVARQADAIILAVADPTDTGATKQVSLDVRSALGIRLATATQIREKVDRYYGPKLIGVLPSGEKLEYVIDQKEVEIGKAAHNHVVLTDPAVSNTHAIVMAREPGYTIVDLGSRNGTFVNGERLGSQAHSLRHGDKVQLGQTVLTFRNPEETAANVTAVLSGEALEEVRGRAAVADTTPGKRNRGAEFVPPEAVLQAAEPGSTSAPGVLASSLPGADAVAPVDASVGDDKDEKKKKKKKKKKEKDARLRAAYVGAAGRVFAAVLSVALTVILAVYLTRQGQDRSAVKVSTKGHAKLKADKLSSATPFKEGPLETSGVVEVPGADMVLMVDDSKLDAILAMGVDSSGQQAGPVKSIPLGASVADLEGIAYGDGYFYVTGSQSDPKGGDQNAIARFKFDPATQTIQGTEVIPNLRQFLIENVPELKGQGDKKGTEGGLNVEGLAWDPRADAKRLLLGLRSPQLNGKALIVAIKLTNPGGPFSRDNLQLAEPRAIQLEMEGLGIRDIQYDIRLQAFLVIAGAPAHGETKLGFKLWEWSGDTSPPDSKLQKVGPDLDTAMHPEGVTHLVVGGREFIFIVGDGGGYTKLDYAEAE